MTERIRTSDIATPPRIISALTRREFLIGAGLIFLAAGCGSGSGSSGEMASADTRSIEHKYGTTKVSGRPERVVTVGYQDQDAVLALGVAPVGIREWFGDYEYGVWPWAEDELGDAEPESLPVGDLNFEQIAALDPDLIIGLTSGMSAEDYETLSEIAPTLAIPEEYETVLSWQEQTRLTGKALGYEARTEELVSALEGRITKAREAHPEFEGKTVVAAEYLEADSYYVFDPDNSRMCFLNELGFATPDSVKEMFSGGMTPETGTISGERLDLLDEDLLIWGVPTSAEEETMNESPLYQRLDVARENRDLFFYYEEDPNLVTGAFSFGTILSIPYLLDELVPALAATVDSAPRKRPDKE